MNQPEIFNHNLFGNLPVVLIDGVEWFGASEAATSLSFANPRDAINNHVDLDDVAVHDIIDRLGRTQKKKFIDESGLYSLIFGAAKQSNNQQIKQTAKIFKRWVTSEVLPAIRKTGSYAAPTMSPAELALLQAQNMVALERKVQEQDERMNRIESEQKNMAEIISITGAEWRKKVNAMVKRIAGSLGGDGQYQAIRNESYQALEDRARCDLNRRLENKKKNMLAAGLSKTKVNNVSRLDIISEDTRLTEIYLAIVKEMAIKYRVNIGDLAI